MADPLLRSADFTFSLVFGRCSNSRRFRSPQLAYAAKPSALGRLLKMQQPTSAETFQEILRPADILRLAVLVLEECFRVDPATPFFFADFKTVRITRPLEFRIEFLPVPGGWHVGREAERRPKPLSRKREGFWRWRSWPRKTPNLFKVSTHRPRYRATINHAGAICCISDHRRTAMNAPSTSRGKCPGPNRRWLIAVEKKTIPASHYFGSRSPTYIRQEPPVAGSTFHAKEQADGSSTRPGFGLRVTATESVAGSVQVIISSRLTRAFTKRLKGRRA